VLVPKRKRTTNREVRERNTAKLLADPTVKLPKSIIGPASGGKGGRPRSGNHSTELSVARDGTIELGAHHAALDHAYNRFLEGIDEKELHNALALSPNKRHHAILFTLTHPKELIRIRRGTGKPGEWGLSAHLKKLGMNLNDLMEVYGRYRTSQAVRIAMDRSPTIIKHTADDAENRLVVCPRCEGLGTLDLDLTREQNELKTPKQIKEKIRACPECRGTGEVMQSGDMEARKLVLEVAGIAGKRGLSVDARTVNLNGGTFSVESFIKNVEAIEGSNDSDFAVDSQPDSGIIDLESE
jgi:uncharacterized protein YbaR (Trm112 family)